MTHFNVIVTPPSPVAVTEVECVREGCQSEALRRISGSVPDSHCFTVVFRGARKSLDLLCPCEDEAQRWVRGLRTLKERVANMTQKEKLDQYPLFLKVFQKKKRKKNRQN